MKTAISVPEQTFERVERVAQKHGMNRSQFYAAAANRYADELESGDLTAAIDAAIEAAGGETVGVEDVGPDESTHFAVAAGRRLLAADDERW